MNDFLRGKGVRLSASGRILSASSFDFAFPQGKLTVLLGRNGAGKTTLFQAMLGGHALVAGEIHLSPPGREVRRLSNQEIAKSFAFVPQEQPYPGDLAVRHFLELAFLPRQGLFGRLPEDADDAISLNMRKLGLEDVALRPLGRISSGERQRAFLARALLQQPRVLLLDEPTNHLDPSGQESFWKSLLEARTAGAMEVVVSTHDLLFAESHAEWIAGMEKGRIIETVPKKGFESLRKRLF